MSETERNNKADKAIEVPLAKAALTHADSLLLAELKEKCERTGAWWKAAHDEVKGWQEEERKRWKENAEIERQYLALRDLLQSKL